MRQYIHTFGIRLKIYFSNCNMHSTVQYISESVSSPPSSLNSISNSCCAVTSTKKGRILPATACMYLRENYSMTVYFHLFSNFQVQWKVVCSAASVSIANSKLQKHLISDICSMYRIIRFEFLKYTSEIKVLTARTVNNAKMKQHRRDPWYFSSKCNVLCDFYHKYATLSCLGLRFRGCTVR